ncbi:MAG: hypothetical protein MI974_20120 [Chitinophagales bacterium]|nr:hypothetical protein [Chitinophagales bacterium]
MDNYSKVYEHSQYWQIALGWIAITLLVLLCIIYLLDIFNKVTLKSSERKLIGGLIITNFVGGFFAMIFNFISLIPNTYKIPSHYLTGQHKILQDKIESRFNGSIKANINKELALYVSDFRPYSKREIIEEVNKIDSSNIIKIKNFEKRTFLVYALDSREKPSLVYDKSRYINNGTNAQEIQSVLADEENIVIKEIMVNRAWSGENDIAVESPDIIIIHFSAFESKTISNGEEMLLAKINTLAQVSPRTHFIVYSRTPNFEDTFETDKSLKGKVHSLEIEGSPKSFMNGVNRDKLKNKVKFVRKQMGL